MKDLFRHLRDMHPIRILSWVCLGALISGTLYSLGSLVGETLILLSDRI